MPEGLPGGGLVASGRIENPAEASDGLKPGVYGITGVFGFHAAIGEPRAYAPDARTARTGRTAWEHPERITPMTKKNIAETNKFAEYLGIATDTLRGIMGNDCELRRRAEHMAIDMGEDGRLARERMRERLRRRPSRGHVDVIAWFLAFAPEYVRDDAELARAVNGTRTWAKASDLAREFDVSAKTLGRWARGAVERPGGSVRSACAGRCCCAWTRSPDCGRNVDRRTAGSRENTKPVTSRDLLTGLLPFVRCPRRPVRSSTCVVALPPVSPVVGQARRSIYVGWSDWSSSGGKIPTGRAAAMRRTRVRRCAKDGDRHGQGSRPKAHRTDA